MPFVNIGLRQSLPGARADAVWALALRKDAEGLRILIDRLATSRHCVGDEDTAEEILDLDLIVNARESPNSARDRKSSTLLPAAA